MCPKSFWTRRFSERTGYRFYGVLAGDHFLQRGHVGRGESDRRSRHVLFEMLDGGRTRDRNWFAFRSRSTRPPGVEGA
jgi:hypothetical protein